MASPRYSPPSSPLAILSIRLLILAQIVASHQLPPDATQTLPATNSTQTIGPTKGGRHSLQDGTRRPNTATVNQICSSQRARNSSLCKPCRCNANGSKSSYCDTFTRRCSCLIGYTGNTCNRCSLGYHNEPALGNQTLSNAIVNTDQDQLEERAMDEVACVSCDDCHHQWHQKTSVLKAAAVKLVERAHKLDQDYVGQIGLATPANGSPPKLAFVGERTKLTDIDQTISKLGERMLDNKQKSDRLNLLSGELELINASLEPHNLSLGALNVQTSDLDVSLVDLQARLEIQSESAGNMSTSLAEIRREVDDILEQNPLVAPRLIERNRNRTRKALTDILEIQKSPPLILAIDQLDLKREKIEFSKRQLDIIGTNIMAKYVGPNNSITHEGRRFSSRDLETLSNYTLDLQSKADLITQLLLNRSVSYQSQYAVRLDETRSTEDDIKLANTTLLLSGRLLLDPAGNLLGSELIDSLSDVDRLLENSIKRNSASLDQIDAKRNSTQAELPELKSRLTELTNSITTVTHGIDKIINDNRSKLVNLREATPKEDLDELAALKMRLSKLNEDNFKLRQALIQLDGLEDETSQKVSHTEALIAELRSMLDDQVLEKSSTSNSTDFDMGSTAQVLVLKSRKLLVRVQTHEVRQVEQELSPRRPTEISVEQNVTTVNKSMLTDSESKLASLWGSLAELDEAAPKNTSKLAAIRLSDKRRLANVKTGLTQLSLMLNEGLTMTYELAEDFLVHGRELVDQRGKIDDLHYQMDSINNDLEQRFDLQDDRLNSP